MGDGCEGSDGSGGGGWEGSPFLRCVEMSLAMLVTAVQSFSILSSTCCLYCSCLATSGAIEAATVPPAFSRAFLAITSNSSLSSLL